MTTAPAEAYPSPGTLGFHIEESLLGGLMLAPDMLPEVATRILPEDFASDANRTIYAAIYDLRTKGMKVDLVTVCERLARAKKLDAVGGFVRVSQLEFFCLSTGAVPDYAALMAENARTRNIERLLSTAAEDLRKGDETTDAIVAEARAALAEQDRRKAIEPVSHHKLLEQVQAEVEHRIMHQGEDLSGLSLGIAELDRVFHVSPTDLVIVAGRPGCGKSALLLQLADHMARGGKRGLFRALEMSNEQMEMRLVSFHTGLSVRQMTTGYVKRQAFNEHMDTMGRRTGDLRIHFSDHGTTTIEQFCAEAEAFCLRYPGEVSAVLVDYLQLISPTNPKHSDQESISHSTRQLKLLAKTIKVPVFAASQLNREGEKENRTPQLSDLRGSGSIEQDADSVLFTWFPKKGREDDDAASPQEFLPCRVIVGKQRNGPKGFELAMMFEGARGRFHACERQRDEPPRGRTRPSRDADEWSP